MKIPQKRTLSNVPKKSDWISKRFSVSAIVFYPFCGRIFLSLNKNGISFIIDSIAGMVEW